MIKLVPSVKSMEIKDGFLTKSAIYYKDLNCDQRIIKALEKLPYSQQGVELEISIKDVDGEGYELDITQETIQINADSAAGAFYAIQTLRQIFAHEQIPCLHIKDEPDLKYRGFYQDVTRGKIPTVSTIKSLIDNMAYYKLNSLQIYVEHVFEFEEYRDLRETRGFLTKEDIKEIGEYCKENFIDFIPSLSTFGHLGELLLQEKFEHLRVLKEFDNPNFWDLRTEHFTIDPLHPESIEVIKSLIDQYSPNFDSQYFNICCDETNDLSVYGEQGEDVGKLYVDFVLKIIKHVKEKNKTVMMWSDVLCSHPETIDLLPEDTVFLNWEYTANPDEAKIANFAKLNRKQIVCPGTNTWSRFCEHIEMEESNIPLLAEYGYKYGAIGLLNTNWGDWGNPCSLELAMYGLVLGAEKSWSVKTQINEEYYNRINFLLYKRSNGVELLKELCEFHKNIQWTVFCGNYFAHQNNTPIKPYTLGRVLKVQQKYKAIEEKLTVEGWENDKYLQEMVIAAQGVCLIAELSAKMSGEKFERIIDTTQWLNKFSQMWLKKNKKSELYRIVDMFTYYENIGK
ncbi:MAG: family 20 glycosylhydrolase [Clostridia bacterium]|nr:family 20 glycosylhydrolase [Clostridia bacterium]